MKILFSPAETKKSGGIDTKITTDSFLFLELFENRKEILDKYRKYVSSASDEKLSKFFGIKDFKKFEKYKVDIYTQPIMKVIERYDGVAFDYLEYNLLDNDAKSYIDKNTVIFSNLFGPLLAGDFGIPEYKLKQGEKIDGFSPEIYYKESFTKELDEFLGEKEFLDLRAGFYNKFYKPTSKYTTLKFVKNGKVVSHWAKAYRGIVLRTLAVNNINTMEDFYKMNIENLNVKEIIKKGIHTEIVFDIVNF